MKTEETGEKNENSEIKTDDTEATTIKSKPKTRGKKRKRQDSDSSTDIEDILPDNTLEVEKSLQASALKNNLDDVSVKKILKKVVTNDHVLALVKLREEEEQARPAESGLWPKLTRAKMKELLKASPKSAPWSLELTPIKGIPVKTTPEVTALIAQELHEDEDDEEYKPTHEDVPSDDDQTLESCSDLESQPRTPATPSQPPYSPLVVKDGPFKVPQDVTPARKKLIMDEEAATIALRTRSKLSLSETPIEHIESSFVPPDDLPKLVVDNLWSEFLNDCLNPASVTRNEDDDEADPEYNVAADPDAHDEDEALENSILKISRKELNDLVTELFNVMPEAADEVLVEDLTNNMLTEHEQLEIMTISHWEGKREPVSDDETELRRSARINFDKRDGNTRVSIGKSEPEDLDDISDATKQKEPASKCMPKKPTTVTVDIEERSHGVVPPAPINEPPPLLRGLHTATASRVHVRCDPVCILPEQKLILQQQLRQHVQLAASNFLQLYVNPVHWALAPTYKAYLEQLNKLLESNADSVVNVCNLKPAIELVKSWENSVSDDTPENKKLVEFIHEDSERRRRRLQQNSSYMGDFPETFCKVVSNSSVFLYPYLLPAVPYRTDNPRRFSYRRSEDELIALGLDQFWQYVEDNPKLYKPPSKPHPRHRWGLTATCQLVCKHMFPWLSPRWLLNHIQKSRKEKDGAIFDFFETRSVSPVKHKLLPFNHKLSLYEQPEHEMPRIWIRYLAKSSKRFRDHYYRRKDSGQAPLNGVTVNMGETVLVPQKNPLPIDFTKQIICHRMNQLDKLPLPPLKDRFDLKFNNKNAKNAPRNVIVVGKDEAGNPKVMGSLIPCKVIPASIPNDTSTTKVVSVTSSNKVVSSNEISATVLPVGNVNQILEAELSDKETIINNSTITNSLASGKVIATVNVLTTKNMLEINPITSGNMLEINPITSGNMLEINPITSGNAEINTITPGNVLEINPITSGCSTVSQVVSVTNVNNNSSNLVPTNSTEETTDVAELSIISSEGTTKVTEAKTKQNEFVVASNMYRVVETSTGAFLVPCTVLQTNTVNSINTPITSSQENLTSNDTPTETIDLTNLDDEPEDRLTKELENHCKCCILLRKICKEKQTYITDFFKPKTEKECICTVRKYPKITKRLRMLVKNYKSKSWCVHRELQSRLKIVKKEMKDDENDASEKEMEIADDGCDFDDITTVLSYQIKLTIRINAARDNYLKRRVINIFSKFDPDSDDPLDLAHELDKAFAVELVDLYMEFLAFLTAEQADRMNQFKDYFTQGCAETLLKMIDKDVKDKDRRREILSCLNGIVVDNISTSCEMCSSLLETLEGYSKLARYVFSLFPHRACARKKEEDSGNEIIESSSHHTPSDDNVEFTVLEELNGDQETEKQLEVHKEIEVAKQLESGKELEVSNQLEVGHDHDDTDDMELTICDESHTLMDYEADHSSCGEEVVTGRDSPRVDTVMSAAESIVKTEPDNVLDTPELTISKTEVQDYCESTDMSIQVTSEDETIKSEITEWRREEDKLILEVLVQYLTPQVRKNKTILEIVEEKNVCEMLKESFIDKSVEDVKQRVLYLLEILVLSDY